MPATCGSLPFSLGLPAGAQALVDLALDIPSSLRRRRGDEPVLELSVEAGHGAIGWLMPGGGAETELVSAPFAARYCLTGLAEPCTCRHRTSPSGLPDAPSLLPLLALTGTESAASLRARLVRAGDLPECCGRGAGGRGVVPLAEPAACAEECCGRRCGECERYFRSLTLDCSLPPNFPPLPPALADVICGNDYDPAHPFFGHVGYLTSGSPEATLSYYETALSTARLRVGRRNVLQSPPITIIQFDEPTLHLIAGCLVGGSVAVGNHAPTLFIEYVLTPTGGRRCGLGC